MNPFAFRTRFHRSSYQIAAVEADAPQETGQEHVRARRCLAKVKDPLPYIIYFVTVNPGRDGDTSLVVYTGQKIFRQFQVGSAIYTTFKMSRSAPVYFFDFRQNCSFWYSVEMMAGLVCKGRFSIVKGIPYYQIAVKTIFSHSYPPNF